MSSLSTTLTSGDLLVFDAVARAGSFGRAAARLTMSQPAVSERVARLEARLQADLFVRGPRGVSLTAAGEALAPFAERQASILHDAISAVRSTAQIPGLVIACHSAFTASVTPGILDALADLERRIEFRDAHTEHVVTLVTDGVADVGIIVPSTLPRGVTAHRLPHDPMICVASPRHRHARNARLELGDLSDSPLAINAWGTGAGSFMDLVAQQHRQPALRRMVPDARTAVLLATDHAHAAFVARSAVAAELAAGRLVELAVEGLPNWHLELDVIHRTTDDRAVIRIVDHLVAPTTPAAGD